jgi:DNA-binding beta-propeller fold protein YncE
VDAIAGKPMGRPKSAVFQTADLVGLDTLVQVAKNCFDSLASDPERAVFQMPDFVAQMVKTGRLGRKSGEGFYKKVGKEIWVLDVGSSQYRAPEAVELPSVTQAKGPPGVRIGKLVAGNDAGSQFAWSVLSKTLVYAANLVGEIADTGNDRVQVFTRAGEPVRTIGGRGRGEGRFLRPVDVAVAPADADAGRAALVFVVERDNHRVQAFTTDGTFVRAWGDKGPHIGLFESPTGLALRGERLYVADRDNHRIQEFSLTGRVLDEWGRHALAPHEGEGRFHYPERIALAPSGRFAVVCEAFEDRFQIYLEGERPETTIVDARGQDPTPHYGPHVAVRGDLCAIVEPARPSVLVFDLATDEAIEITRIAHYGRGFGQLLSPTDVEIHPTEPLLYVADAGNERLSVFRLDREPGEPLRYDPTMGRFVKSLDLTGIGGSDEPVVPVALEFAPGGELLVLDGRGARVLVLDRDLAPVDGPRGAFGRHGTGPGELSRPTDLALSPDGETVWIVDAGARAVLAFGRDGAPRERIDGFTRPWGIAVDDDGTLWVSDEGADAIRSFDEHGPAFGFGRRGLARKQFARPRGLDVDGRGRLFVLDHGNHRAQVFTPLGDFVEAFGPRFFVTPTEGGGSR